MPYIVGAEKNKAAHIRTWGRKTWIQIPSAAAY